MVDDAIDALAGREKSPGLELSYAGKAFANVAFFQHLARRDIGIDVCSLGEIVTAERAGIDSKRLTLHGAGKTVDELQAACDGRVGTIAVDGIDELEGLAALARDQRCAAVLLRLNVGIEAHTHAFVRTGGDDTKFGIHPRDESTALAVLRANPQLRFAGLHAHIGSQIFQAEPYLANVTALLDVAARFAASGLRTHRIVIGGGFGVPTHPEGASGAFELTATVRALAERVAAGAA
ncbi:MAG: alanine racemase, partial [Candidatus Cybelea sp.]